VAGRGFAPKETRSRPRDAKRRAGEQTHVTPDKKLRGPVLPRGVLPDGEQWHPRTKTWWETWRKSPQAQVMVDTDWDFLLDTALLHHAYWAALRTDLAAELRLRVAKFGATMEDRLRLKLTIDPPETGAAKSPGAKQGSVASLDDRRKRLTS
jgi:hypothetical protein